jgi:hypothetical protein
MATGYSTLALKLHCIRNARHMGHSSDWIADAGFRSAAGICFETFELQ